MAVDSNASYRFGGFHLNRGQGLLRDVMGREIALRPKTLSLLLCFLSEPNRLLTRDRLVETVWPDVVVGDDPLTQCLSELRRALEDTTGQMIRTLPRRGYMMVAEVSGAEEAEPTTGPSRMPAVRDTHSVLILQRLGAADGDPDSASLAGALTAELVRQFSRAEDLRLLVAADRRVPGEFLLSGEVRRAGGMVRATMSLEDGGSGSVIWAERLEQPAASAADLDDDAVGALVLGIIRQINREVLASIRTTEVEALGSYQLCLAGKDLLDRSNSDDVQKAVRLFERAASKSPDYAPAHALNAYAVHRQIMSGLADPEDSGLIDNALEEARRAVQLDPDSPFCLAVLALTLTLHQRWDEAAAIADAAVRTGRPATSGSRSACAKALIYSDLSARALEEAEHALQLEPNPPPVTRAVLGQAMLLNGRSEEALNALRRCTAQHIDYAPAFHALIAAAVETGRMDEARTAFEHLARLHAKSDADARGPLRFYTGDVRERLDEAFAAVEFG